MSKIDELMKSMEDMKLELEKYKKILESESGEGEIHRFPEKEETKILKMLRVLFREENKYSEESIVRQEYVTVVDPAHVIMIQGLTEEAKRLLSRFVSDIKNMPKNPMTPKYYLAKEKELTRSAVSVDYLVNSIKLLEITSDYIIFFCRNNCPIRMENKNFVIVLAPRIDENDEKASKEITGESN